MRRPVLAVPPASRLAVPLVILALVGAACGSPSGPKVGIIGDSITDLSQSALHGALDPRYDVELVGKFGARADEVVPEAKVIAASHPREAIINLGTNDALQRV